VLRGRARELPFAGATTDSADRSPRPAVPAAAAGIHSRIELARFSDSRLLTARGLKVPPLG
jgi:hypothetical protein